MTHLGRSGKDFRADVSKIARSIRLMVGDRDNAVTVDETAAVTLLDEFFANV